MGRQNPITRTLAAISTFGASEAVNIRTDIMEDKANKTAENARINAGVRAEANKALQDKLTAEESVRAQKEKSRKQTIFAGGAGTNLFNKSLIGASTTAATGNTRSILGA